MGKGPKQEEVGRREKGKWSSAYLSCSSKALAGGKKEKKGGEAQNWGKNQFLFSTPRRRKKKKERKKERYCSNPFLLPA